MLTFRFPAGAKVTLSEPGSPVVDAVDDLMKRAALAGLKVTRQGGLGRPRWILVCTDNQAMQLKLTAPDLFAAYPPVFSQAGVQPIAE